MSNLLILFAGSLLASTVLPGGIEIFLYTLYHSGTYSFLTLLVVSTVGNTLGGLITYFMGALLRKGATKMQWHNKISFFFKLSNKATRRVEKFGVFALLFSWLPVIGDSFCVAAGYLRLNFWSSALAIFIGKFLRYLVLLWIYSQV